MKINEAVYRVFSHNFRCNSGFFWGFGACAESASNQQGHIIISINLGSIHGSLALTHGLTPRYYTILKALTEETDLVRWMCLHIYVFMLMSTLSHLVWTLLWHPRYSHSRYAQHSALLVFAYNIFMNTTHKPCTVTTYTNAPNSFILSPGQPSPHVGCRNRWRNKPLPDQVCNGPIRNRGT